MVKLKILKIVLKFIGFLVIISIIGGVGIMLTKSNEKLVDANIEENVERLPEEVAIQNDPLEVIEEIPEIQEVAVVDNNDVVAENKKSNVEQKNEKSNVEQKNNTNNQSTIKQESNSKATLPETSSTQTTPSVKPGGVEHTNNNSEKCTNNNNHDTKVGYSKDIKTGIINIPTGWYKTEEDAKIKSNYIKLVNEGSEKWGNYDITTEEYERDYPSSYECWTCGLCKKYTIQFGYDK